ncbi:MAG: HEAT repeat domain-containing protein, partial [Phycisphaeraceae bacterium]|nr:HEAT repeat domain-containing protein [Phycisphaeraceae bacterium]
YHKDNGLSYVKVPTPVFHDSRAMLMAADGLKLNRSLSDAYSLWVASNFRRGNNLPEGKVDKSYGPPFYPGEMRSPDFFGRLSGPRHLHPALDRSLRDQDPELALDVIRALHDVANPLDLTNAKGQIQPLVAAMNYPDQRVRFEAAEAIAHARPRSKFNGDQRVVPVLAEAIQWPADTPHALIITKDKVDAFNDTITILEDSGEWVIIKGTSIENKLQEIYQSPRINLIVVNTKPSEAVAAVAAARVNHKTQSAPVLVLTAENQILSVNRVLEGKPGIFVAPVDGKAEGLKKAVERAVAYGKGKTLTEQQSQDYAVRALESLLEMAIEGNNVFNVLDAKAAAISALKDPRNPVAFSAARFLARLPTQDAQHALLATSINGDRGEEVQVQMLLSLASSARMHGNQLNEMQLKSLSDLIETAVGDVADAAAAAWGSLDQPTEKGLTSGIVGKPKDE